MTINVLKIKKTSENVIDVEFLLNEKHHIINDVPAEIVANSDDIESYIANHADEVFYLREGGKVNATELAAECGAAAIDEFRENCVYENNAVWDAENCDLYISPAQFYLLCQGLEIEGYDGSFYSLHEEAE